MTTSRKPKRTLRSDIRRLRRRASGLISGGEKSKSERLRSAGASVLPALVGVRELFTRGAVRLWALAVRAARLGRRGAAAAAIGVAGAARRVASKTAAAGSAVVGTASKAVTPRRTLIVVTLAAAALLAASQFTDYTGVRVGTPEYAGLEQEAPAPLVKASSAGSAHAWVLLGIAVVAVLALIVALRGRWRVARLVSLAGLAGLAVALIVDLPKGLREGAAGVDFAGAKATLLDGFYVEVAAAAVLTLCGVLLARHLAATAPRTSRRARAAAANPLGVAESRT